MKGARNIIQVQKCLPNLSYNYLLKKTYQLLGKRCENSQWTSLNIRKEANNLIPSYKYSFLITGLYDCYCNEKSGPHGWKTLLVFYHKPCHKEVGTTSARAPLSHGNSKVEFGLSNIAIILIIESDILDQLDIHNIIQEFSLMKARKVQFTKRFFFV